MLVRPRSIALFVLLTLVAARAEAINVVLDYSYDASSLFDAGTPNGQVARETLQAAADFFSDLLSDSLSAVETPTPYVGAASTETWAWEIDFFNPADTEGAYVTLTDQVFAVDEYRVYVAGDSLTGDTLGLGGPGGATYSSTTTGPAFSGGELAAVNTIDAAFADAVDKRGESTGFAGWGGSMSFNADALWTLSHESEVLAGTSDLYSVALHEIGHVLGMGTSSEWYAHVDGSAFIGPESTGVFGGPPPLTADGAHWAVNTMSTQPGTTTVQEAAMDPNILIGTRKVWTALDNAGLVDIGWTVARSGINADYNDDGVIDAADYTVWRDTLGSTTNLAADGWANGRVDYRDYQVWSILYTNLLNSQMGDPGDDPGSPVPEPAGALLAFLAAAVWPGRGSSDRR